MRIINNYITNLRYRWRKRENCLSNRLSQGSQPANIIDLRFWGAVKYFTKYFGVMQMLNLVAIPRICDHLHINTGQFYINNLLKFQRTICKDIVEKYRNVPLGNEQMPADYKIWTCWWQGREQMPEVIRLCHESLLRNANGHEVILITQENYRQYVNLPQYIYDKVESGNISFSHFSDMIRLSLLCQYGGHWVDSALYITKPLHFDDRFHMSKMAELDNSISQGRWWFGNLAGAPSVKVFHYMLDCLLDYWMKYDAVVNYLMFDGFLRIAYEDMADVHECIDNLPVYSPNVHETRYHFHEKYEKDRYDYLVANNDMLSLTWRINYPTYTPEGELTFFGKLIDDMKLSNK